MGRIHVSVEIDATPADVWRVIELIERHVDWMMDAEAIHFIGGRTRGVGTRFVCHTKIGPIRLADEMEIVECEAERKMAVRHRGLVTGLGVFELEPIDVGRRCRFSWTENLRVPWFLGGRVVELAGGHAVMKRIWRQNLRRLRQLIELRDNTVGPSGPPNSIDAVSDRRVWSPRAQ